MSKKQYQVTIGYKACICVTVKAESEKEAKEESLKIFDNRKRKMFNNHVELQDDNYNADGVIDLDATWNMVQN